MLPSQFTYLFPTLSVPESSIPYTNKPHIKGLVSRHTARASVNMTINDRGNNDGPMLVNENKNHRPNGYASTALISNGHGMEPKLPNDLASGQANVAGLDFVPFPALPVGVQQPFPDQTLKHQFPCAPREYQDTDAVTAVLGAWGLVVGAMVESDSHVFGIPISTRKLGSHKDHKDHSIAPVHVNCTKQQTIEDYLRQFQEQTIRTDWFAQGLSDESPKDHDTGSLQTLLHVRPQAMENGPTWHESREASHYALVLDVQLGENDMTVTACFDSRVIQPWLVQKLLERLDDATAQVYNADPKETLASIDNVTPKELEELWERNRDVPAPAERCVSEVIEETARTHPTAQAICAWDGSLSYRELDQLATLLAAQLVDLGVGPEVFVSLVFEKSMWTSVAILAVLKAGGAFVLLDTSLPEKRLQDMARQVESKLALSSSANYDLSTRLVEKVLTVTSDLFKPTGNADLYREIRSRASPSSAAYVVFTSGSTGTPKGVVITNQNVVSVFRQTDRLAFKPDSRVYDFPPYSFGLSILMCLPALAAGSCLCVPNNQDRKNNLAHSIKSLGANVIWLTPSAAGTLSPATVPGLRMIGFGGEVAQLKDALAWWGHAEVRNGYGSSETSTLTALNAYPATPSEACHLGTGAGVLHWIVDPEDHNILLPIGSVGELLVEGPHVGRGYLNDPAKTKAAFIEDPTWLIRGSRRHRGRHGRLYKTGDLVQYTESGSLKMIGRKDMQVKIRGQRVELGEVEFRLRQIMPEVTQAVAEVIIPQGSNADPVLATFLLSKRSDSIAKHNQAEPFPVPKEMEEKLAEHLPSYMIPTIFFSMSQLPMTATGKTNRKELRQVGGSFSTRQLADIQTAGNGPKLQPTTQIAQQIQEVWSRILGLDVQQIGLDDSFFKLGGNSVAIIKVVGEARKIGIQLEVTNIFRYPTLRDVAEKAVLVESSAGDIAPYSLLGDDVDTSSILHEITADFQLDLHKVQDMYPCSPLQEGLFLLTSKRPGDYVMQLTLELSPDINVADFQRACEEVVRCNSILRTRIVQHKKLGMLQVVLDEGIHWIGASGLGHYLQTDREQAMIQGQPLTRYALVEGDTPSSRHFVWTVHHALYDGWSMPLIIDEIDRAYKGETLVPGPQFRSFIHHIRHQNKAKLADYWQQYLESCDCVPYPALPSSIDQPVADGFLERTIQAPGTHYDNVTQSTIIRAAWAVVAGRMTGSTDVVFGVTVSGRHASVPNMDQLAGPTIATVPVRVKLDESLSVGDYVKGLQQQSTDTIPYEQFGLQSIGKMSPEGRQACNFQTLIIVQPEDSSTVENAVGKWQYGDGQDQWTNTYPLTLDVYLDEEKMVVKAFFDSRVVGSEMVQTLLARLDYVIQQIDHAHSDQPLTEIEMLTTQDLQQIWEWNAAVPVAVESGVLDAIDRFTTLQPSAPALYAWDGELSYRDLTAKALRLASHLVGLGVRPGQIVPLCFEKSMWTTVAILGVLKAGAAFVLLDPALPDQRLQAIVEQVKPTLVLSSVSNESRSLHLCGTALPISSEFFLTVGDEMRNELPRITTSFLMYVIFTSGSTGTPKGVMISHGNWASALHYQSADQGFTSRSRLYDFASYSFDTCVSNIFFTLGSGGCLCVPREQDRKDRLAESIRALRANLVELTPSVSLILGPSDVPELESLVFGGEALRIKDVKPWWGKVQISNTYGPSECTPTSVMNCNPLTAEHAANIGKGSGIVTWVVDPQNHDVLLPPGCTGEMLLEGPLVGLGYLNDQQKTAAAFINDPAWLVRGAPGRPGRHGRLYKTGDLVQYREDGNLFYVGRKDDQVKIRGQRVELGEVEHWVQEFMQEATYVVAEVITPQGNQSAQTLVTFLEVENCEKELQKVSSSVSVLPIPADVEDRLGEHLPSYMVPSIFFIMPKLPIGPTGKRDRKQLRNIGCSFSAEQLAEMRTMGRGPKRQPTNELEQQMQSIWAQVLDIKSTSIGIDDSFFQLGGNSIDAMIVAGEAHKIGLNVTAADIFLHRTLSKIIKECRLVDSSIVATIPINKQDGPVLQSFAQERLWFLEQLHPGMTWYHMANAVRFRGPLRLDALHAAIQALENRHETLRTTFMSKDGVSMQTIHPFRPKDLTVIDHPLDENALQDVLQKEQRIPFDLTVEPGWRVKVFRLGKKDHVLSLVMHHIICDGWSVDVLRKELGTLYSAALKGDSNPLSQLDPLPKRYQDYSLWQRQEDQIAQQQPQLEYWVNELQGSRPAEFLCDKPRPASLSGKSDQQLVRIDGPLFDKIQRFCREHDVTPFIVLLAAFRSTHYRLSNQSIAAIGCPNANRDRWELKDMIGFFVNMQCYCIRIDDQSFREVVRQVEGQVTAAIANQDVPFERVVANLQSERDMSRNPLVQTIFALHPQININRITLEGLDATQIPFLSASRFDLEFHLYQEETAFQGGILYSTDLYHPETIRALLSVFQEILEQGLSDPDTPVASLPLLTETDFNNVKDMGLIDVHKTNYPRELNILDVFRQQVGACPNRVAVKDSSAQLTYTELDQKSEVLARWLASRQFAPEKLIGIFGNRSCETVVSILGILKANLAYLPFDDKVPASRMETILSSIPADRLVLVGSHVQVPHIQLEKVEFVQIADTLKEPYVGPGVSATPSPSSLAYVMFTSGSTGQPKGVMIEHRNILRLAKESDMMDRIPPNVVMGHIASLAFDASTWEIYTTLLNGGTLICIDRTAVLDTRAVARTFAQEGVKAIFITPLLLKQYLHECPDAIQVLEMLVVGGDRLDPKDMVKVRELMAGDILNGYGPTENTSFSTFYRLQRDSSYGNGVPIGRSLSNSGAYVMDSKLRLVPLGVVGELVVTGDGLARGYTDPGRNVDRFVSITIGGQMVRAYRTGDYVRYRPKDGELEILGRGDGQVKIRGQRVEVGEVEHVLRSHDAVSNAVVIPTGQGEHTNQLVAVVTAKDDWSNDSSGNVVESEHHGDWEERFDSDIYLPMENVDAENIGRDFIGWTSMYDGKDIDKTEMNEWLDDTMEAILNAGDAGHVLEIGTGSGMILFNLGKGLQSYTGLDPSERAVRFVTKGSKAVPALAGRVHMFKATAADINRMELPVSPDLAIINSVAQYFPSEGYLFRLVEALLHRNVRTIFFGDMRSYALHRQFLASRALYMAGKNPDKNVIRKIVDNLETAETEFLTDPAFFTALADRLPELVGHVEILPKRMNATNELSCYRYAAVIHAKDHDKPTQQVYETDDTAWIDFIEQGLDRESLLQLLRRPTNSSLVAISNIPHKKTIFERFVVESLGDGEDEAQDPGSWISNARQKGQNCPSLSSVDLIELAEQAGFRVEISWARQFSQSGGLDAIFHHHQPADNNGKRVLFRFPTDHKNRQFGTAISSRPLRRGMENLEVELSQLVEAHLPSYMVPQKIAVLDEIPLNSNGKVDRRVLGKLIQSWTADHGPVQQPTLEAQLKMQGIWAEVLHEKPSTIGVDANFFKLGGNSIAAMRVAAEACKIGFGITVADIFRYPQLDQLTRQGVRSSTETSAGIPRTEYTGPVEQSFAQGRLWFIEELHPGSTAYLMPRAMRIRGPLHIKALHTALRAIETRHETLRTTFSYVDSLRLQEVQPVQTKDLEIVSISPDDQEALEAAIERDRTTVFDLHNEPGWRVTLYKLAEDDYVLSVVMHHIISDGWSVDVLCRELGAFYSNAIRGQDPLSEVAPLPIQYRDYSVWQKTSEQIAKHEKQLRYWTKQLQDSRPAELLCDKPRPTVLSGHADVETYSIDGPLYDKLQQFCQARSITPFTALLTVFRIAQFRLTGQHDATIGILNANRQHWELKDMIGFFVNMQCIRTKIEAESETFEDTLQQVHETVADALLSQDVPFDILASKLQRGRDLSRNPLVQLIFVVHSQHNLGRLELEGVQTEILPEPQTSGFDLEFHFYPVEGGLRGEVLFSTDLYLPESIRNLLSVFHDVLAEALEKPTAATKLLPSMTPNAFRQLDQLDLVEVDRHAYPRMLSVVDLFRQQVEECGPRIAVRDSSKALTYSELDILSDKVSEWLVTRSFPAEALVGVFSDRCCETIVAFLAILKANLVYLPFDIKTPPGRMETILSSIPGKKIVLVGPGQTPPVQLEEVQFVSLSEVLAEVCDNSKPLIPIRPTSTCLAYVMFTSGSTGKPKGVMVEHRGIVRLVKQSNMARYLHSIPIVAHVTNIAFDVSTWEIYSALLNGGTLVCIEYMKLLDHRAMAETFARERVETAIFAPALLKQCISENPAYLGGLNTLFVAGDRADARDMLTARKYVDNVVNAYGPTENSVISTLYCMPDGEDCVNGVPIGRSITNSGAYVVDEKQRIVPLGVIGELVVTGDGLARGYTDPQYNDRFITLEVGGEQVRAYRTGDYVRYRPVDGQLEFFGRLDGQVKLRGHRIELREVEHALRTHKSVQEAVVILHEESGQEPELAGFVTVDQQDADHAHDVDAEVLETQLRNVLRHQLPPYMVPRYLSFIDKMPVNANGKVDRRALTDGLCARKDRPAAQGQPATEAERQMQSIWAKVLRIDVATIGREDDFFLLGANSIAAMNVVAEARKMGMGLEVADLFKCPTIAELASLPGLDIMPVLGEQGEVVLGNSFGKEALLQEVESANIGIETRDVEDIFPVTSLQDEFMSHGIRSGQFCNYFYLDMEADVDLPRLEKSCVLATGKFPLLRSRFVSLFGKFWQILLHRLDKNLHVVEVSEDLDSFFHSFCANDAREFSPTQPPFGFTALRQKNGPCRLVLRMSHAQYDGLSLPIIAEAIMAGYLDTAPPEAANFSIFLSYAQRHRAESIKYWQKLLQGSSPTTTQCLQSPLIKRDNQLHSAPKDFLVEAQTAWPKLPPRATCAALVSAAWAILLSCLTGKRDIVYGHLVAGRNAPVQGIERVVGPCVNIIPIRAHLPSIVNASELLGSVQDQLISLKGADSLGFKDIINECTSWSSCPNFDFVIQHQNVDERPVLESGSGDQYQLHHWLNPERTSPFKVFMISYPQGDRLRLTFIANTQLLSPESAKVLLDGLVKLIAMMADGASVSSSISLDDIELGGE